jgi:serine phosphatase RsbU (regulator of sigma subunit)
VTALAGLDLAIGGRAVLVGLLVVGPMLAAAWQGPRATAAVGVYTVGVSVLLGAPDNIWGTADHLLRSVGITAGAALAVWLAGHRVGREAELAEVTRVAEAAQRAILRPPPPTLGELHIAARYRSAASASLVGGDMFEVVDTDWGVRALVGDVRGKGLEAVRTAALVLGAFRARAHTARDVGEVVEELDKCVARHVGAEDFVTAVVVEIHGDELRLANAGHPPPVRLGSHARTEELGAFRAPPLGLGSRPVTATFAFERGDRVAIFTDGLTEARDRSGHFLSLRTVATALATGGVESAADRILSAIDDHTGGQAEDDLALLVIERAVGARVRGPRVEVMGGARAVG